MPSGRRAGQSAMSVPPSMTMFWPADERARGRREPHDGAGDLLDAAEPAQRRALAPARRRAGSSVIGRAKSVSMTPGEIAFARTP